MLAILLLCSAERILFVFLESLREVRVTLLKWLQNFQTNSIFLVFLKIGFLLLWSSAKDRLQQMLNANWFQNRRYIGNFLSGDQNMMKSYLKQNNKIVQTISRPIKMERLQDKNEFTSISRACTLRKTDSKYLLHGYQCLDAI